MHRPAPLLGAVTGLVERSCSRIPHLRVHILRRQSQRNVSSKSAVSSPSRRPAIHTTEKESAVSRSIPHWSAPKRIIRREENGPEETDVGVEGSSHEIQIQELVRGGHPERVLLGLLSPAGIEFIEHADEESFSTALQTINPESLFDEFKDVYRYITPSLQATPIYRWTKSLEGRFETFSARLDQIIQVRRRGRRLTLPIYRCLLDCARVMGDGDMAENIFHNLMREDAVVPDHACYNSMMEAICWNGAFNKPTQWRFRVTRAHQGIRASHTPPVDLGNIKVAQGEKGRETSVRSVILERFKEMVADGFTGDERTFASLMVAMGREADIEGVKSVLKSVWNINVDMLGAYDEEELESPTFYEDDSPLRPSHRLLFTVAHVFGSNNDVGTALSLTDYISRNYNLDIPPAVWLQLCEWTQMLTKPRSQQQIQQGQNSGKVDAAIFEQLWQTMTDKPHNIVPDVTMLILRVKSLQENRQLGKALDCLRHARELVEQQRRTLDDLADSTLGHVSVARKSLSKLNLHKFGILSSNLLNVRHKFILASLRLDRDLQLLLVAVRRYFKSLPPRRSAQTMPGLILEFTDFLPNELTYKTPTGRLTFDAKFSRKRAIHSANDAQQTKLGIMRALLDRDNHADIVQGLILLPSYAANSQCYCWRCGRPHNREEACVAAEEASITPNADDEDGVVRPRLIFGEKFLTHLRQEHVSRSLPVYANLQLAR